MNSSDTIANYMTAALKYGDFCTQCRHVVRPDDICISQHHHGILNAYMLEIIGSLNEVQAIASKKKLNYGKELTRLQLTITTTQDNLITQITNCYNEIEANLQDTLNKVKQTQEKVKKLSNEKIAETNAMTTKISEDCKEAETSNGTLTDYKKGSKFTKIIEHKLNTKLPNNIMDVLADSYGKEQEVAVALNSLVSAKDDCRNALDRVRAIYPATDLPMAPVPIHMENSGSNAGENDNTGTVIEG
jgi:hypothetical protein